jgi:SAM-dependent methyltransferase
VSYDKQDRGSADAYAAYFAGMNQSMQQKVALTTAHFPPRGVVADMGSGSGQATFDLANLYSGLTLVGVDVNPTAVAHAHATYQRPNLSYRVGDIADPLFDAGSLHGILDSSVLHHVTSFNDFSLARLDTLLDNQVAALAPGGVLIIRDFVVPDGPDEVLLDLSPDDLPWFERFVKDFRSSQNRGGPVPVTRLGDTRVRMTLRAATEFVLRKDYRDHWDAELQEEYTYFSQRQFEEALRRRGLRITVSMKLYNPWIVAHRFAGRFTLRDLDGRALAYPPTNYLIVGEKLTGRLHETHRREVIAPKFLRFEWHGDGEKVYELVQRPNATVDVLPWFEAHDRLYVLAKHGYPRPITQVEPDLLGMTGAGYVTEPLAAIGGSVTEVLRARAGLTGQFEPQHAARYFTSPGGISECVDAYFVRVPAQEEERTVANYSSFTSSGSVRFLDAAQVLRASHIGGMFDARLELNTALLLHAQQRALGPWIGAEVTVAEADQAPALHETLPALPVRKRFHRLPDGKPLFLQARTGTFVERDGDDRTLATADFEYVVPRTLSCNTITLLPVMRVQGRLYVGVETRDLPAVQAFEDTSAIYTVPAKRLPRDITTLDAAEAFALRYFSDVLSIRKLTALGGRYHASLGVTPEVVYPYVAEVASARGLTWVASLPLQELRDAHLLIAWLRCMHATALSK